MTNRFAVSIDCASLLASSAAFAQSTTVEGARRRAAGGAVAVRSVRPSVEPSARRLVSAWKFRTP